MGFRGLFIGIDKYASADINELNCAKRDAVALEALFADTLGGRSVLLTDYEATRARIEQEFVALKDTTPDDTVVIAFSGHGSETHELVAHDTTLSDIANTTIQLDLLQEWFSAIPAKRLILFLDCCFSGGIGAKVLQMDVKPRDLQSVEARLEKLAGTGRIIFTASSANEPAFEHGRYGHGFLTYFLLEALRGIEELTESGKLSLYRVLDYVTQRVKAAAHQIGRPQNPTMRGTIDGGLVWPIFVPGTRFHEAFPEQAPIEVTEEIASLAHAGFPEDLISAWAGAIPSLNSLQLSAINEFGLLSGDHLAVSAPTSSGKTMIGELAALRNVLDRKRALFLLPLKALVADKRRHFDAVYKPFGVRTIEATGETDDISPLIKGQYDIGLLTYEKFAAIALSHPHVLAQAGVIVVDEAQMIADAGRGANLEFVLTLLRMRRREGLEPQLIALSAVIGDTNGFEQWLGGKLLRRTERPVPLDEGLLLANGNFRFVDATTGEERNEGPIIRRIYNKNSSQDWIIPLVKHLLAEGQQVIVFRETKGHTRGCANYLAQALGLPPVKDALDRLPEGDPSQASADLRAALQHGVAFHNADLEPEERRIIEEEFRRPDASLRVIAATTTLAMGVNTPASSVVIAGLEHPGKQPYSVAEYKNLVGRAGRLGYAEKGTSYLIATDPRTEYNFWNQYVTGSPEDLQSRFLDQGTDTRSLIVRVLVAAQRAAGSGVTREQIVDFLEASFGAFQASREREHWSWDRDDVIESLDNLVTHDLIETDGNIYELTLLGRLAGESTTEVSSIIRMVEILSTLTPEEITDPALVSVVQLSIELDDIHFPLNRKSTQKEPQVWPSELRGLGVAGTILNFMNRHATDQHQPTLRAKKAVAALLFVSGRPINQIEQALTQFGGAFGGAAGPVRSVASRTCDLLPTAARIAEILHPTLDLGDRIGRLAIRLTYGVPSDCVDLARELGSELLRGDYTRLSKAKLCEPEALDAADDQSILECLDGDENKLGFIRKAIAPMKKQRSANDASGSSILEEYVA